MVQSVCKVEFWWPTCNGVDLQVIWYSWSRPGKPEGGPCAGGCGPPYASCMSPADTGIHSPPPLNAWTRDRNIKRPNDDPPLPLLHPAPALRDQDLGIVVIWSGLSWKTRWSMEGVIVDGLMEPQGWIIDGEWMPWFHTIHHLSDSGVFKWELIGLLVHDWLCTNRKWTYCGVCHFSHLWSRTPRYRQLGNLYLFYMYFNIKCIHLSALISSVQIHSW